MSIFTNSLKTFESDITGELKEYNVNNAVYLYLKSKFKLTQGQWGKAYGEDEVLNGAKFVVCVLKANNIDTTLNDVIQNTNALQITEFLVAYQNAMLGDEEDIESEDDDDSGK